jgi:UDP-N-acetylmuramoyl-tripeptide--D-alanyl-D-alanine ligase
MTLAEVAEIVGGRLANVDPAIRVSGSVEFDSRLVSEGGLFLALPGERVDGHDFIGNAFSQGAVAAIVTHPVEVASIEVDDGFAAIAALAAAVVRRLTELTVISITGSSGKTSTKDMLAHTLAGIGPTVAPPGSFNNELGYPYTVLRADERTRFLVLEASARGIGHIRYLSEIARPRIGVELNVGTAHLGEFGSRSATAQAKGELVEALPTAAAGGVAVLNADDPLVVAMATRTRARVVTVGESRSADVRAEGVQVDDLGRARFTLRTASEAVQVRLGLFGRHHVGNALAVAAVALECGMTAAGLAHALSSARPAARWRMELTERPDGVLVINDAYNANPESMRAALEALASIARARRERGGRSFAVLGPMAELGPAGVAEHEETGRLAVRLDISRVIAVGEDARPIQRGAALEAAASRDGSRGGDSSWVPDVTAAIAVLRTELRSADVVMVKASRAASLERVALAITDDFAEAGDCPRVGDSPTTSDGHGTGGSAA